MSTAELGEIGRYRVERLLGEGAYCTVFEARDKSTGERIALKQLTRVGPLSLSNFKREFRMVQGVHHPNLVELRELFEVDGECFIAMELVDGDDLITHLRRARAAAQLDVAEVVRVFAQLAEALRALHAAGIVHRDVKPANVLVTPRGRVVLLDFGMAKTLGAGRSGDAGGTAEYMAPEQAAGSELGPAADFYAFGICLYEALSGHTPFRTHVPLEALLLKQQRRVSPLPPSDDPLRSALQELCMSLLELDPARRPQAGAVLRALQGRKDSLPRVSAARLPQLSGRDRELQRIMQNFASSCEGEFRLVLTEGESGIGKSALSAEFCASALRSNERALLLRGRCYENEQLAYEAFDGAMEQLARSLVAMEPQARKAVLPPHAGLLSRLFPAFAAVPSLAWTQQGVPADPAAARMSAFRTLGLLLAALARRRPLAIAMEDLQWADAESFRLLRALAEAAPRPGLLIVATVRPAAECSEAARLELEAVRSWSCTEVIALDRLSRHASRAVCVELLGPDAEPPLIESLVTESGGHPMLLTELARFALARGLERGHFQISLETALRTRLDALGPQAEQLIGVVAVAGRPYPARVIADAAGLEPQELNAHASELLAQKLLRRRRGHELVCYHDRIREVALRRLDADLMRVMHAQLAAALGQHSASDPAELARHHDAAGHGALALGAYARAAQLALDALAFTRAEQLSARGLALFAEGAARAPELAQQLRVTRGHALARGGRSREAAHQYQQAAEHADGVERIELRVWATQHLLLSAECEAGFAAAREVLAELGLHVARGGSALRARTVWDRLCFQCSRKTPRADARALAPERRIALQALWTLSRPLQSTEPAFAGAMIARHLRLAFDEGDSPHMARALVEDAVRHQLRAPESPRIDMLLRHARSLCDGLADPGLDVTVALREASVATTGWQRVRAVERLEHAHRVATAQCAGEPWLLTQVRAELGSALAHGVEHGRLTHASARWLAEARDRNDCFATALLVGVGFGHLRHLMQGQPGEAGEQLRAALAPWPRKNFGYAHLGELLGTLYCELYRGGDCGLRWLEQQRPWYARAALLRMRSGRATLLFWRSLACLRARGATVARARPALLAEAHGLTAQLGRDGLRMAKLAHSTLRAQLLALEGRRADALAMCRSAGEQNADAGNLFLANSLRYLQGRLQGGSEGDALCAGALARLTAEGWQAPHHVVLVHCPVLDELEGPS